MTGEKGITLVEIIVVVFIIAVFSSILVIDFPKIQANYTLSRAAYKMAQNIRRMEDMGISGAEFAVPAGQPGAGAIAQGFGVYVNMDAYKGKKSYILYADTCGPLKSDNTREIDYSYTTGADCSDYAIEIIDMEKDDRGVEISAIYNIEGKESTSINFAPPNPDVNIENIESGKKGVGIALRLEVDPDGPAKEVWVSLAGLIEVK